MCTPTETADWNVAPEIRETERADWLAAYTATVGAPPAGSVPLPVIWA